MSCGGGNRFQCGITRFQKHSFTPDKPSNVELHNENQKRLSDLLKAREEIDKQFFSSNPSTGSERSGNSFSTGENNKNTNADANTLTLITTQNSLETDTSKYTPWVQDNTTDNFTPWRVPSTSDFQGKAK
jgi:hypothetical protein